MRVCELQKTRADATDVLCEAVVCRNCAPIYCREHREREVSFDVDLTDTPSFMRLLRTTKQASHAKWDRTLTPPLSETNHCLLLFYEYGIVVGGFDFSSNKLNTLPFSHLKNKGITISQLPNWQFEIYDPRVDGVVSAFCYQKEEFAIDETYASVKAFYEESNARINENMKHVKKNKCYVGLGPLISYAREMFDEADEMADKANITVRHLFLLRSLSLTDCCH